MKRCTKCGVEKLLEDFPPRKDSKDGRRNECFACKKIKDAEDYAKRVATPGGKSSEIARAREFRANCSEDYLQKVRDRANERNRIKREKAESVCMSEHGSSASAMKQKAIQEKFISAAKEVHGDRYNYSLVDYQGHTVKVKLTCVKHNLTFAQTPKDHKAGRGCPECGKEATGLGLRKSQEDFIKDAKALCGDKYTYDFVDYVKNSVPVVVTCTTHGNFPIRPGNLLTGKGCPACAKYGYRDSLPGTLYVLSSGALTKIGITNNTATSRLKQLNKKGKNFELRAEFSFADGKEASTLEGALLSLFRETHLQPAEKFDGSTECFYQLEPEHVTSVIDSMLNNKEQNDYRSIDRRWETPA